jgi:hypothetical protein
VCINGISYIALRGKNITAVKTSAGVDVFAEAYGLNNNLNSY